MIQRMRWIFNVTYLAYDAVWRWSAAFAPACRLMRQQTGRTVREARALGQHRTRRARSTLARIGRLPARLPVAEADACAAETCRPPAAIWNRSGRRSASPTLPSSASSSLLPPPPRTPAAHLPSFILDPSTAIIRRWCGENRCCPRARWWCSDTRYRPWRNSNSYWRWHGAERMDVKLGRTTSCRREVA